MSKKQSMHKVVWFSGGFALGITLISLGHAALPSTNSQIVSEMKAPKVTAPDLEQDYEKLSNLEQRYAESWDQQQRIRSATTGVMRRDLRANNNAPAQVIRKRPVKKVRQ